MAVSRADIERDVRLGRDAHVRLLGALDREAYSTDRSTRLPGWTFGHLVTHLARNADSHRRMIVGAGRGETLDQYDGGVEGRTAEIEAGRDRSGDAVVEDLRRAVEELEESWEATDWHGFGMRTLGSRTPIGELPFRRLREIELHHVDLDIGYEFVDLDPTYVRRELRRMESSWTARRPMGTTALPTPALALDPLDRLAWFTGRRQFEALDPAGIF